MWNSWMEQAKRAAANLDQQLNESVGVDSAPAKPSITGASGAEGETSNVWNDDDFKFDDDDEEEVAQTSPCPQPVVAPAPAPAPVPEEKPAAAAPIPPAVAAVGSTPTTPQTTKEEVSAPPPQASTPKKEEEKTQPAVSVAETPVIANKQSPVKIPVDQTGGSWAEDDNPDFDNFDGVAPQPQPEATAPAPAQKLPGSPMRGIAGALKVNLGGLGQKVQERVQAPVTNNEINFMSPFSSLMTSINQDQEQQQQQEEQEEKEKPVPETPLKEETKPPAAATPPANGIMPAASQDDTESAWQEEDIDLDEDSAHGAPPKVEANKVEEAKEVEEAKKQEEAGQVKEEKKVEEKPEETKQPEKADETLAKPATTEATPTDKPEEDAPVVVEAPQSTSATTETTTPSAGKSSAAAAGPTVSSAELEEVKKLLAQREGQLAAKAEQMFQLQTMYEKEKQDLMKKVADTKDEAKKRILKARERCEAAEAQLQASTSALTEDAAQQAQLVAALREEGQKLAHKQSEMERTVRAARGEARELQEHLEFETAAKEEALAKIEKLQAELKSTQEQLSSARKGETQAGKLDIELQSAREDIANKDNTIMSLEASVKELKAEKKDLIEEVEISRQGMAEENLREAKKLRKEHNAAVTDLEAKLQTSEREAALREDQLRHEVEELRKRWQDAVRRADALSMDVQSSTAPLLRQLESMERQHRARASAAAELETKLRAELEETVILNEKLTKDYSEMKTKHGRVERLSKEQESDLADRQKTIDEMTAKIARLEEKLQNLLIEGEKRQEEYEKVERLANEGVSKVRSEMSQAVLDSEERYRSQLESMKEELRIEQEKRSQLEKQVDHLLENAAAIIPNPSNEFVKESKPAKLVESEGQAQILSGALRGLGGESDDDDDDNYADDEDMAVPQLQHQSSTGSSYAALEQLTQNLKTAKKELATLKKQLAESEKTRESLVEELGESREAKEKLPLFEAKVKELMVDNREKELEIRGLQDDIAEVKEMYRAQLSVLLEEKAAAFAVVAKEQMMNGNSNGAAGEEPQEPEQVPELVEDALGGIP